MNVSIQAIALIVILFALVVILDFRRLVKQKLWKDCVVYIVISVVGFSLLMLTEFGVEVPSPFQYILKMFSAEK